MEKKLILLLFTIALLIPFCVNADTISNYNVKDPVKLGQEATAFGLFQDADANLHGNVLCSFYFLDENNVLIDRANDQYTDSLGYFMGKFTITEPDFKREERYTIRTVCGGATQDGNFLVAQRESIAHSGTQEFDYLTSPENTDTILIWGLMILIILVILFAGYKLFKIGSGR